MKYFLISFLLLINYNLYAQTAYGCISGNCKNGEGSYRFSNGDVYKGGFKRKKPHGKGKMTFKNGNQYKGEFKKGEIEGYGTMKYSNGDYYRGEWKDGKYHGWGSVMAPNDKTKQTGIWENGVLVENRISGIAENHRWKPEKEKKKVAVKEKKKKEDKSDFEKELRDRLYEQAQKKANYEADENSKSLTMTSNDCSLLKKMTQGIDNKFEGLYLTATERPHPQMGSHYKVYDTKDRLFNMEGTYSACDLLSDYDLFFKMKDVKEDTYNNLLEFIPSCLGSSWTKTKDGVAIVFVNGNKSMKVKKKYLGDQYYEVFLWIKEK